MRDMTSAEIDALIREWTWGTLIGLDSSGPYAIELSYGFDGQYIYCGSMPGGRMARCIRDNQQVAFKICDCGRDVSHYRAVIIEGTAERQTVEADILRAVRLIARQSGFGEHALDHLAALTAANPASNSLRIPLTRVGGKVA